MKEASDTMAWIVIFLFALTFCGKPDLHDILIKRLTPEECVKIK